MNTDFMTPTELRALADKMEKENCPVKKGYLKFDLYNQKDFRKPKVDFWLLSKSQKDEFIKEYNKTFELVLKKGTEFVCYVKDGKEAWFDDVNYGVESMDKDWAKTYLENITPISLS